MPAPRLVWLIPVVLAAYACSDARIISGTVYRKDGSVAFGLPVQLIAVDDRGEEMAQITSTVSDAHGRFRFALGVTPGSSLLLESLDPSGRLRGFPFDGESRIHPLTDALVGAVLEITGPKGGRTLLDFDTEALREITDLLFDLDSSGVDLTDAAEVHSFVTEEAGRAIAEASGATYSAGVSADFDPENAETTPTFATTVRCALSPVHELTSSDFTFDLTADGRICDGYSALAKDGFDLAFQLSVSNDTFVDNGVNEFPSDEATAKLLDDRTLVMGPQALTSGVTVTRKVFIPQEGNYARFLDIIQNPTATDRTLDLEVRGNLGSDITTVLLAKGGDSEALTAEDRYAATCDTLEYDATVGVIWQDNSGISVTGPQFVESGNPDLFSWLWQGVSVPAAERRTFLYFTTLSRERTPDVVGDRLLDMVENPDMTRMSVAEIMALSNFAPDRGNISGEAGSVVAGSAVTVENRTQGVSVTTTARKDWSFYAALSANSGDSLHITASDGLSLDITVE